MLVEFTPEFAKDSRLLCRLLSERYGLILQERLGGGGNSLYANVTRAILTDLQSYSSRFTIIQLMSWDGAPELSTSVVFSSLGRLEVPLAPPLPFGVRIENHVVWVEIRRLILEGWSTATFEELDIKAADLKLLQDVTGCEFGDVLIPYLERPDWLNWSESFEEAWAESGLLVEMLFEEVYESSTEVTCRVNPPSIVDLLKAMLAKAELKS